MSTKQTKKSNSPKGAFARSLAKKDCSKSCKAYLYPEDAYIEPAGTVGTAFSEDGKLYLCLRYRASDDKKPVEFCPAHNLWVPETDSQATLERRNFTESTHNGIHHKKGNVCYLIKQKGKAVWGVYSDPELLRNLAAAFPDEEEQAEQEEEVPTGPGSKMEESDQEKEKEEEEIRTEEDSDPDEILCTIRTTVKPTGPTPLVDLTGGSGSIKWAAPHVDEEIQSQGDLESQGLEDEELQRRGEEELRLLEHEEHLRAEQEAQEYEEHQKREAEELQRKEEEERQRREEMEHQRQEDEERQRELEFQKEREKLLENPEEKAPEVTNEKAEEEIASAPVDPAPARKPIISTSYHHMNEPIAISIPARPKKASRKRKTPTASKDAPEKEDAPVAKGKRSRKATKFYGHDQEK